jgi:DNA helicase-2/ATP-dependent DNA helicase PcrA
VEAKQKQHVLDYDDLLLCWAELMKVPELASEIGGHSITCWSTNIRTLMPSKPPSCWASSQMSGA